MGVCGHDRTHTQDDNPEFESGKILSHFPAGVVFSGLSTPCWRSNDLERDRLHRVLQALFQLLLVPWEAAPTGEV